MQGPTNPHGLAYNRDNDKMYLICNATDTLYTMNLVTGHADVVGSTGAGTLLGLVYIPDACIRPICGTADFDGDGDSGTDFDIEAYFACLAGSCCPTCFSGASDFNMDGDAGTDADIEAFFRVLAGGNC